MQYTDNYNLKKPDRSDYALIEDLNENMDTLDGELHTLAENKVEKSGGDVSAAKVATIGVPTAEYPEIQQGASLTVIFGRIRKFLTDLKANCLAGLSVSGRTLTWTKADGTTGTITTQDTTYSDATQSAGGLMSAADKKKLDGIEAGAQTNSVTGIKGNAESTYRTGQVNITPTNIGAAPTGHASADTSFGLGNKSAYGHVMLVDSVEDRIYAAGEALAAAQGAALRKKIEDSITGKVVTRDWSWGGSFKKIDGTTDSYVTVWRSGEVVVVTIAAYTYAAVPAKADRNILTNLPAARNRVYAALSRIDYDEQSSVTNVSGPIMCSIRPDINPSLLKVDGNLNPFAFSLGVLFGTFAYITSEQ